MGTIKRSVSVEGGKYRNLQTGEIVTAICWKKDGDHPGVVRYPIEGREYKGLLEVAPKEKYSLRFGDWIIEAKKAVYVVQADKFTEQYEEVA